MGTSLSHPYYGPSQGYKETLLIPLSSGAPISANSPMRAAARPQPLPPCGHDYPPVWEQKPRSRNAARPPGGRPGGYENDYDPGGYGGPGGGGPGGYSYPPPPYGPPPGVGGGGAGHGRWERGPSGPVYPPFPYGPGHGPSPRSPPPGYDSSGFRPSMSMRQNRRKNRCICGCDGDCRDCDCAGSDSDAFSGEGLFGDQPFRFSVRDRAKEREIKRCKCKEESEDDEGRGRRRKRGVSGGRNRGKRGVAAGARSRGRRVMPRGRVPARGRRRWRADESGEGSSEEDEDEKEAMSERIADLEELVGVGGMPGGPMGMRSRTPVGMGRMGRYPQPRRSAMAGMGAYPQQPGAGMGMMGRMGEMGEYGDMSGMAGMGGIPGMGGMGGMNGLGGMNVGMGAGMNNMGGIGGMGMGPGGMGGMRSRYGPQSRYGGGMLSGEMGDEMEGRRAGWGGGALGGGSRLANMSGGLRGRSLGGRQGVDNRRPHFAGSTETLGRADEENWKSTDEDISAEIPSPPRYPPAQQPRPPVRTDSYKGYTKPSRGGSKKEAEESKKKKGPLVEDAGDTDEQIQRNLMKGGLTKDV
ncbi:hypothetical protein K402DRAFT_463537 [Aulographum hederae CBS 113979]|uniref:Uncharacterized protein n=1 Tax=Aulographum hederae CBS 113979 TaxID=1176131 RepID=A0A6G1H0N6_9PEZI|nr:hypothetical protein K402DRAFT_463537 [Aulographum hederae CBS 113979]